MLLRWSMVLCLSLSTSCITPQRAAVDDVRPRLEPKTVRVDELPRGRLRLTFDPVESDLLLARVSVEEARVVLASFHESIPRGDAYRFRLVRTATEPRPEEWERRLREEFVVRYGPPTVPLPGLLETSPVFLALKLSPRYMGKGDSTSSRGHARGCSRRRRRRGQ
ncbi:hypothetical protein BON30_14935 [Cystobacter ferrugineus]|uniref:Uncharacterized protein n=1 Tax=Cystobacter ferrugineus TaxID=83449 RepID=A0A1L9BDM9_9BACT|nr:hypothetical protein BON30_14935 [Cystobacter ferrugineus]